MGNIQFINAGAGSGKTYTLTKLFCQRLAEGAKPSEFVLTTYTKAAADEFRSKIKAKLMEEGMNDMLSLVESAQIGTIHSVAQSFIEKYWYLLDMSPALAVKEEDEMKAFRSRILDSVASEDDLSFFYNYATMLDVKKSLGNAQVLDPDFWKDMVLELVDKMRLYGFKGELLENFKQSSIEIVKDVYPAYTMKVDEMKDAAAALYDHFDSIKSKAKSAMPTWNDIFVPFIDEPSWEKCLPLLKFMEKTDKWILAAPQDMFDIVRKYALSCVLDQALECVERVFAIAARLLDKISEYKRAEGILEFSDLEVLFLELLSFESVRTDLADSIKYVFVDEFQDVSPIQLKIFQALGEIVGDSCWVGDPKQAIYGFRGSDSSLVNSVITSMKEKVEKLEFSHRSLPQLVNASNDIFINSFALLTDSEKLERDYVKLDPCEKKIAEQAACGDSYIAQHKWWLSVLTKTGAESTDKKNASKVYPAVATKLWNIFNDKKYKVTDTENDQPVVRDLKYGDVAILTRSNKDCIKIADELRAKGLPVSVLDEKLENQAEVRLVLTLMKYMAGIDKTQTVAELRRLMNDEDIETILLGLAKHNDCTGLLQLLDILRERYQYHSVYDMAKELIAALDLRHLVCKWSMGQKRQTNLDVLVSKAASFVKRQKEASVQEFICYVADSDVDVPFDNTGNTIKVLTYHKSKGLQWKMVILNSLHKDSLEDVDFMKKDFSKITVKTTPDGQVSFNLFPPVDAVNKMVAARIQNTEKAHELWDFLKEKKRAEDLRLLYVGFTRAENYLISLSFGAVPSKWLENTRVTFSSNVSQEPICDDSTLVASLSQTVSVLPYDNVVTKVEGKKKYISPSQCETDPQAEVSTCELEKIADNIDVARWNIDADVFGTCIHNYMAVHRWASDKKHHETNVKNAGRVLAGFGLEGLLSADALVAQADAFFAYVEKQYGEVKVMEHEIPFTQRKDGQVITGEIDLYVKTESGAGILVDFKNPMTRRDVTDQDLKDKAIKYWPQLEKYRSALCLSGSPVDQVFIYYPLLGIVAKF